jgi:uncharacterized protein (TIGR02246 family)
MGMIDRTTFAEGTMPARPTEPRDFIPYPTNRVVGTIADADNANAAIDALVRAGFDRDDIDMLHGEADVHRLDPTGAAHGLLAQAQRTLIRTAGPNEEYKHLMRHVEDLRAGRFVIMVLVRRREQRMVAADLLGAHGAEFVGFYGRWAWEALAADEQTPAGQRADTDDERNAPTQPEQIPLWFAEAWNARDPDALAALFDDDAEFVNVTGLWWHDRASIRKAHAYGLERIFNRSTLIVEETKVKRLRDDVAIVHARMTLTGQTPIGGITQPGSRANIFSFIVHRGARGWLCAAAHNTDVVPGMETNIIGEDGTFRSANYRSGQVS